MKLKHENKRRKLSQKIKKQIDLLQLKRRCFQTIEDLLQETGEVRGKAGEQHSYKDNQSKILAVAHLDTVQKDNTFGLLHKGEDAFIYNPKLDDRLGVYVILDLLPSLGINLDILLTENEESGASTAGDFTPDKIYNWGVEFDRKGTDAVDYGYKFDVIEDYFKVGSGIFSDISVLDIKAKCFNVGIGYYNYHSKNAYFSINDFCAQIARFILFYEAHCDTWYECDSPPNKWGYVYNYPYSGGTYYNSKGKYDGWDDWDNDVDYGFNQRYFCPDCGQLWDDEIVGEFPDYRCGVCDSILYEYDSKFEDEEEDSVVSIRDEIEQQEEIERLKQEVLEDSKTGKVGKFNPLLMFSFCPQCENWREGKSDEENICLKVTKKKHFLVKSFCEHYNARPGATTIIAWDEERSKLLAKYNKDGNSPLMIS